MTDPSEEEKVKANVWGATPQEKEAIDQAHEEIVSDDEDDHYPVTDEEKS